MRLDKEHTRGTSTVDALEAHVRAVLHCIVGFTDSRGVLLSSCSIGEAWTFTWSWSLSLRRREVGRTRTSLSCKNNSGCWMPSVFWPCMDCEEATHRTRHTTRGLVPICWGGVGKPGVPVRHADHFKGVPTEVRAENPWSYVSRTLNPGRGGYVLLRSSATTLCLRCRRHPSQSEWSQTGTSISIAVKPRDHALWLELVFRSGHLPASCTGGDWQLVQTLCKSRGPT